MVYLDSKSEILVVEDDPLVSEWLCEILALECFSVTLAQTGTAALDLLSKRSFELVLLDMYLPDMLGLALFTQIQSKAAAPPCVFLSGHEKESDIVQALQMGAEDYLLKPLKTGELLARIRKVLNRRSAPPSLLQTGIKLSPAEKKIMEFGSLKLDFQLREAHITQRKVKLTKTEFEILFFLATHPHEVMSRDTLISQLWLPEDDVTDRIIDTHIRQIRQKLKQALPNAEKYIITVRGVGYYFNPQPCK